MIFISIQTIIEFLITIFVVGIAPVPWWLIIFHYLVRRQSKVISFVSYFSIVIFWIILGYAAFRNQDMLFGSWFTPNFITRILGFTFILLAALIDWQVMKILGIKRLLMFVEMEQKKTTEAFVASGIYRYARHPRYVEYMLIALSVALFFGYIFMFYYFAYLAISFWLTTFAEESELVARFGKTYQDYQKKIPRFFIRF